MLNFGQIPEFISCTSNLRFVLFGLEANWGCIASYSVATLLLIIIVVCLICLGQQSTNLGEQPNKITGLGKSLHPIGELVNQPELQSKELTDWQIVDENLSHLPHDWIDGNTNTGFSLRAPNGKSIPIYSKWTATELLDRLKQATDKSQKDSLKNQIREEVDARAKEAMKFLDKERTLGFCILAVPDLVLGHCLDMQGRLAASNIVLISYNLLIPNILLTTKLFLQDAKSAQGLQTSHTLSRSIALTEIIQTYVETQVRPSIDIVRLQQSQHIRNNAQLQQVHQRINQIQAAINALHNMLPNDINPLDNEKIASIPQRLKILLNQLREGLLDGNSTTSSTPNPDSENK